MPPYTGKNNRLLPLTLETVTGLEPVFFTNLLYLAKGGCVRLPPFPDGVNHHKCSFLSNVGVSLYIGVYNVLPTQPFGCELRLPRN
jgi:hypothetical protein